MQLPSIIILMYIWGGITADPLLVRLPNGVLQGRDNGGYLSYETIPYAEPPLKELRLESPQPFSGEWTETFDATKPPPHCLQWSILIPVEDKIMGQEDCLTVSVYKPKNESRQSFPVLVVIHGGAFMFGGAQEVGHEFIMASGGMILVKINYRLGPLGFLSTEDTDLPGNLGLKDQQLALKWIKENIVHFGGEPDNILLFGHSAGGASVHLQLLHKDIKQLAKAAISISGNALNPWTIQPQSRQRALKLAEVLNCNDSYIKDCLKSKNATDIVSSVKHFLDIDYVPFAIFGPVVEPKEVPDAFLSSHPSDIIKSGLAAEIPWLTSYTTEDGGFNAGLLRRIQPNGQEIIEELNTRWKELAPDFLYYRYTTESIEERDQLSLKLKEKYLGERNFTPDTYWEVQQMFTDILFKNSVAETLDLYKNYTKSPVYVYVYDNPGDMGLAHWLSRRTDLKFGTVHCDDMMLMFNNSMRILRPDEEIISSNFIKMFTEFSESDNGNLNYANCEFVNNINMEKIQLMSIKSDGCENVEVEKLP